MGFGRPDATASKGGYELDEQVGYLLRLASQRHAAIFQDTVRDGLTPMQFSTLMRLAEQGEVSQNRLGRLAAMDIATVKGVVDRLRGKGLVTSRRDPDDGRRFLIGLTGAGRAVIGGLAEDGAAISAATLAPLSPSEQRMFLALLRRLS